MGAVDIQIRVKNYRCFGDRAVGFSLHRGITGFIGGNNTGKSTMLRLFYDLRDLFRETARCLEEFKVGQSLEFTLPPVPEGVDRDRLFHRQSDQPLVLELTSGGCDLVVVCQRTGAVQWHCGNHEPGETPMVRDLHMLARMFYVGPFRPFQNSGLKGKSYDLVFGSDFFRSCCRDAEEGSKQACEELQRAGQAVADCFGLESFEFQPGKNGDAGFAIDGNWQPVEDLGSGIGQTFLIFLQVVRHRPSFVLIDEPEAHLHPSVQSDFLTQLAGFGELGLLTSTHHLGLARSVSDHLYLVSRNPGETRSRIEPYKAEQRLSETLGELQVAEPKRGGGQKLLLVEGPTEIKAIRKLLAKIDRNHRVVLLPLGGSSMINGHREDELKEVRKICSEVYALVDSERPHAGARESDHHRAFRDACRRVGITCHILERRALENYFSGRAIKQVLGHGFRELKPFETVKDVHSKWPKSENWKIVQQMSREEFAGTDLWEFLQKIVD